MKKNFVEPKENRIFANSLFSRVPILGVFFLIFGTFWCIILFMEKLNKTIATNLAALRKSKNITQAELGETLSYTDKAISKWETGEAMPDINVLYTLANIYNVSLDYLVTEHTDGEINKISNANKSNKIIITSLSVSVVLIVATICYVYLQILNKSNPWILFVWAIPLSVIVLLVFNGIWGKRKFVFILISIFTWTFLASIYLQFLSNNIWPIFLIGAPFQIAIILWSQLKKH